MAGNRGVLSINLWISANLSNKNLWISANLGNKNLWISAKSFIFATIFNKLGGL